MEEATALSSLSAPQVPRDLCRAQQAFAPHSFLKGKGWGDEEFQVQKVHDINMNRILGDIPI